MQGVRKIKGSKAKLHKHKKGNGEMSYKQDKVKILLEIVYRDEKRIAEFPDFFNDLISYFSLSI